MKLRAITIKCSFVTLHILRAIIYLQPSDL